MEIRWLKSNPTVALFASGRVDYEAGIVYDVVMVEEGEAKGHGVLLDRDFIADIVAYDQKHFSRRGLKARFGHPSASNETMGTQMGVFRDFSYREKRGKAQAVANLHLLDASEQSPTHPGMRSWVLGMAEEAPDLLMSSIVFSPEGYFQQVGEKKVAVSSPYSADEAYGPVYVVFGGGGAHYATDIVEEGAATTSLFSNTANPHLFVAQADQFLHDHPNILEFIRSNPEKVTAFFASIGITLTGATTTVKPPAYKSPMSKFNFFKWLSGETEASEEDIEVIRTELSTVQQDVTALKAEKDAALSRVKELSSGNTALQSAVAELETQLGKAQARITELEAEPAAPPTGAPTGLSGGAPDKNPATNSVYKQYGIE